MSLPVIYTCKSGKPVRITGVDISLMSPEEIRRMSVVQVTESIPYEKNLPKAGGVYDHRLGPPDRRLACGTCGNGMEKCNGHIGHMELFYPVYHVGYMDTILKLLRATCPFCCRLKTTEVVAEVDNANLEPDDMVSSANTGEDDSPLCYLSNGRAKARFSAIANSIKPKSKCAHCGGLQPEYRRDKKNALMIEADWNKCKLTDPDEIAWSKKPFTSREALDILSHIPDEDYKILGFDPQKSHPSSMVITALVIPPVAIRPPITETEGSRTRGQDDLTQKYRAIASCNNEILKYYRKEASQKGIPLEELDLDDIFVDPELSGKLQIEVATCFNNDIRGLKPSVQRSGAPMRSITGRWRGKEGRIRGNLSGKRTNFCARTVASPDPNLDVDELGVAEQIAMKVTYPETVTPRNIKEMATRVKVGPNYIGGAASVVDLEGKIIHLSEDPLGGKRKPIDEIMRKQLAENLQIGWKVNRFMQDGDIIVVNRQPTLHRGGIQGHRVRIQKPKTFAANLSVTTPYNLDFDGDEINIHLPQNELARAEVSTIMGVPNLIISPKNNQPSMGLVQDALVGTFLMTRKNIFLDRTQVMDLMMQMKYEVPGRKPFVLPQPAILKPQPLWTGKQIFSLLIPTTVHLERKVRDADPNDNWDQSEGMIVFRQGDLLSGALCKKLVGTSAGGLVHVMCNDVGQQVTCRFLSDAQRVVNRWLSWQGFSVGLEDCMPSGKMEEKISKVLDRAVGSMKMVYKLARQFDSPKAQKRSREEGDENLELSDDNSLAPALPLGTPYQSLVSDSELEAYALKVSNMIIDKIGGIIQQETTVDNNSIHAMVMAGSKGNLFTCAQMRGGVGQICNEGKRIRGEARTLPCYKHKMMVPDPESNGLTRGSYLRGLTPEELFFHTMGGREGLVDTAVKTAETGYMQRRLAKSMESHQVTYGGVVKDAEGLVIEFSYGNDGMDAGYLEKVICPLLTYSNEEIRNTLSWNCSNLDEMVTLESEVQALIQMRDRVRLAKVSPITNGVPFDACVYIMCNPERILTHLKFERMYCPQGTMSRTDAHHAVQRLCATLRKASLTKSLKPNEAPDLQLRGMDFLDFAIRSTFTTKVLVDEYACNYTEWKKIKKWIKMRYHKSFAQMGEMVGALAAESVGEPATQMTLNTFHYAGWAAKNVTLGVPRLKEILDATRKMKKPSATVYLKAPFRSSIHGARIASSSIEYVDLAKIAKCDIVRADYFPYETVFSNPECTDEDMAESMSCLFDDRRNTDRNRFSRWAIRYTLNKILMMELNLTPWDVVKSLETYIDANVGIVCATDSLADVWVVRIHLFYVREMIDRESIIDLGPQEIEGLERMILIRVQTILLKAVKISGIKGITKATPNCLEVHTFNSTTGGYLKQNHWVLETEGTALLSLMGLPQVDATSTFSNDAHEVTDILGIEAGATILYNEIKAVVTFDGTYVNDRHMMRVVNTMTRDGYILAMSRHGINRVHGGFLARSSFEETVEILFEAAAFAERDRITDQAVVQNIMLGQMLGIGTGVIDVLEDEEKQLSIRLEDQEKIIRTSVMEKNTTHIHTRDLEEEIFAAISTAPLELIESDPLPPPKKKRKKILHPFETSKDESTYAPSSPTREELMEMSDSLTAIQKHSTNS